MTFEEWVLKHNIGPGMNDGYYLERTNARRLAQGEDPLPPITNYSGYDGTVGVGWVPILDRLATQLKALGWDGAVHQIKEKFGGLRFYANPSGVPSDRHDDFQQLVREAEEESIRTCEDCGQPGTRGTRENSRWIRCLCESCRSAPRRSSWLTTERSH